MLNMVLEVKSDEVLIGDQTINRAAIRAAVQALGQARAENLREIRIFSDSDFLITSVNQIYKSGLWQRTRWTTITGQPVKNRQDFEDLLIASTGISVMHWRLLRLIREILALRLPIDWRERFIT
uniref:RNase H type-1 domain-containing protein n=1 Tax=Strigamia maritima TaxID=126957 RepID=T1IRC8_STRMM